MGTVFVEKRARGSVYRAEVRREGQRVTKRFPRLTDARKWIQKTETKINDGKSVPRLKRYTVSDAIEKYEREIIPNKKPLTQKLHLGQLALFKAEFGAIKLHKITSADLSAFREKLRTIDPTDPSKTRSPSTLNRTFQPFFHCLRIAKEEWKWIQNVETIKKFKENPSRAEYYSPEEIRAVLSAIEARSLKHIKAEKRKDRLFSERMNLCIARIAIHTGARLGEICKLKLHNIDFVEGLIRFPAETNKIGVGREIPMSESLKADLLAYRRERNEWMERFPGDYFFPALRKSKRGHRYGFASKVFSDCARNLGIKGKTFHDVRHTTATWANRQNIPTRTVQVLLGHQKISTTERYTKPLVEGQREAVEGVSSMLSNGGQKDKGFVQ